MVWIMFGENKAVEMDAGVAQSITLCFKIHLRGNEIQGWQVEKIYWESLERKSAFLNPGEITYTRIIFF